ncbi:MAG: bifunctional DNA-formamidopyrimidine glycosylase/DNA-(apurinic or apyrimidinic site) lyase [Planctomycetota bacterium]|nr:bifunctional DNA-formamidopyrimidine glycosylase/DNA-(apurinic or apyrimidinic site) lyase [Planctomycetota bacterium]
MPELPEIEHLKSTLEPVLVGASISRVVLSRCDILRNRKCENGSPASQADRLALLAGASITSLDRHGKQLVMIAESGSIVCIHLGMSGQLRFIPTAQKLTDSSHVHCTWTISGPGGKGRLIFRDPRRFGGLWTFKDVQELLDTRWSKLGPDALTVKASALKQRLGKSTRSIKATLLDQSVIAGVGNIYADEALFDAGLHPLTRSCDLEPAQISALAKQIRQIMRRAIKAGGSSIRSYVDGTGKSGRFVEGHRVYGRGGQPCLRCGRELDHMVLAQRSTVACPHCQPMCESR